MTDDLFPSKEDGMFGIVHVCRFAAGTIQFNDGKIFSLLQFLPGFRPDVHPAKIKLGHFLANPVDGIYQFFIRQIGNI